jgi:hypothetical protein
MRAATNLIELSFLITGVAVAFGIAQPIGQRFGWWWGIVSVPVGFAAAWICCRIYCRFICLFLYPGGTRKRPQRQRKTNDSNQQTIA